jgi:hypothetical protein
LRCPAFANRQRAQQDRPIRAIGLLRQAHGELLPPVGLLVEALPQIGHAALVAAAAQDRHDAGAQQSCLGRFDRAQLTVERHQVIEHVRARVFGQPPNRKEILVEEDARISFRVPPPPPLDLA